MPYTKKYKIIILFSFILSIFFLNHFCNIKISYAKESSESLIIPLKFQTFEFCEKIDSIDNATLIDIELPSSTWTITHIDFNFTDIEYYKQELKTIEDNPSNDDLYVDKHNIEGLGVQISLNETTTICGAYLNVKTIQNHTMDDVHVQIRGYNSTINAPNSNIYGHIDLNHTIIDGWNYQNFSSHVILPKGNYFLVLEGYVHAGGQYHWYYNDLNPNSPDLYISKNNGSGWGNGIQGSPFLYKLDQEIKRKNFYPEEFNMTAEINGNSYEILNGLHTGSGTLKLTTIDFSPKDKILHILIKPNRFFFNLIYYLKLKNQINSNGFVTITEDEDNYWTIIPEINRCNINYSIKMKLPNNYYDLIVLKDGIDITTSEDILIDGNVLHILNDTINDNANWEITTKSPKIDFTLDLSRGTKFELGTALTFSVIAPIREGNFTFIIYNELGAELNKTIIPVVSDETVYSLNILSTASLGNWTAHIYWNSDNDAGVKSQEFTIIPSSSPTSSPPDLNLILIIIVAAIGGTTIFTVYQTVKRKKRKSELKIKKISNKFKDILSLNYLMISDINSGVNVYEQFYMGKSIDPSLISGFLDAIKNFGIELTGSYRKTETMSLDYEDSIILMNESDDFRLIIITSDKPSEEFTNSITNLANDIEEKYGDLLREFKGGMVTQFTGISKLIEKHLNVSFASPLKIAFSKKVKLNAMEKSVIEKANEIMKQTNLNYFYTTFLMPNQQFDLETTKVIFNLIEKKIFQPINLNLIQ
ncbi:MAG: hypothetical protein ACFFAF_17510 [Candidatus Hermodarchaeota archaeon]